MTAYLIEVLPSTGPKIHTIEKDETMIGRNANCDIVVNPHFPPLPIGNIKISAVDAVSKNHLTIERMGEHWKVVDQDSFSGTYVNGQRIRESVINHGDRIKAGSAHFVFINSMQLEWTVTTIELTDEDFSS